MGEILRAKWLGWGKIGASIMYKAELRVFIPQPSKHCYTQTFKNSAGTFSFFFPFTYLLFSETQIYRMHWNLIKAFSLIIKMLFCTSNWVAMRGFSASTRLWYRQPPCNISTTTRYFQRSKEAGQSCYHGTGLHHFRNHSQLLTRILRSAVIPFKICFCDKNSISRGRVCSCSWSSSAKFLNSLLIDISWSKMRCGEPKNEDS